jgi:hypothetical protein
MRKQTSALPAQIVKNQAKEPLQQSQVAHPRVTGSTNCPPHASDREKPARHLPAPTPELFPGQVHPTASSEGFFRPEINRNVLSFALGSNALRCTLNRFGKAMPALLTRSALVRIGTQPPGAPILHTIRALFDLARSGKLQPWR